MTAPVEQAGRGVASLPGWLCRLGYYGLAVLFVAATALLRWEMGEILSPSPFLIFYLAWVGAAAFGGLGPGLLATVASWLCVDFLFDTTPGQVGFTDPTSIGRLVVLMAGGLAVSVVGEKMRRARIRERRQGRKLAELAQSLEREKETLQSVMNGAKNSHLVFLDRDFNFVRVNEAYARTCGYTPEEMVGKNHFALYPHAENEAIFSRVRETGVPVEFHDKPFIFPDQPERGITYWDWTLTPVKNDSGYVEGLVFSLFETTQRKRAEEALRERMKELACLYAVGRDLQEELSLDELCRRAVAHLAPALQFPDIAVPVIELNGKRFISKNYAEGLSDRLQAEIRGEGEVLGHLRVYYARERPFIVPEEQNLVNGVAEALSTWLVRQRAEEALRESEEKYRYIVETATEGIVMADAQARMVFVNDRWSEISGYSLEEAGHITIFDLVFPEDRARMAERWESRKRGVKESYEFRFRRKDGSAVWALIGVAPRLDPEGRFLGTLVMVTDITQRKRAEEALHELTRTLESKVARRTAELERRAWQLQKVTLELSEAEERERERLGEILHDDLQQILVAARFHLDLLGSRVRKPAESQEILGQVRQMLKDAIDKSRSLSHELGPAALHQGDLAEALNWLAEQVQAKHGLTVRVEAFGEVETQSSAARAFVYRAVQELLFNVVKHARVHEARIRVRRFRQYICLSVSDHGRGFEPQEIKKTAGFGLLSIRERVTLLGGGMKIKSAKGKGTTFHIIVPEAPAAISG